MSRHPKCTTMNSVLSGLKRSEPKRECKKRFLIVCEDSKSAPNYFKVLRKELKIAASIEVCPSVLGTDPVNVVQSAIDIRKKIEKESKTDPFDSVWAVFDADIHLEQPSKISSARQLANRKTIKLAISNPCFEYWVILHFENYGKTQQTSKQIENKLSKLWQTHEKNKYEKGKADFSHVVKKYDDARNCAEQGRRQSAGRSPEDQNPCSEIYLLIDEIQKSIDGFNGK